MIVAESSPSSPPPLLSHEFEVTLQLRISTAAPVSCQRTPPPRRYAWLSVIVQPRILGCAPSRKMPPPLSRLEPVPIALPCWIVNPSSSQLDVVIPVPEPLTTW